MADERRSGRFLGITVLGDFILSEGVEAVLDNVRRAGATAVACNPTVTVPASEGTGSFQPPADAGSSPRVFDRPLWGRHALWVRSGPSYHPNAELYRESPYGPRQANELTEQYGAEIGRFIEAAAGSGLKVYFQIGAAQPSKLRDADRPRLPDGRLPQKRMADTASLASDAVRAYNRAYVQDLLAAYPQVSGFRPDWPESPCYTLGEVFQDFSPHVKVWAQKRDFDFEAVRDGVGELYGYLQGRLTNGGLQALAGLDRGTFSLVTWMSRFPAVGEWLRLKAALSADLLRHWRTILDEPGGEDRELSAHAFMPPYSLLTGFDFPAASACCDSVLPKLYTMHWSLMVKFWGEALLAANPGLDERLVVRALVNLMDLADSAEGLQRIDEYGYPNPDEPHPIPDEPQRRKIALVKTLAQQGGRAAVYPLVHGYGPLDDFRRRLQVVADSEADGVWINRYGYLSDEKLEAVREVWDGSGG